jgi:circadian clock protein KaiC
VEGAAGTGKTVLGMEFIYRGVTRYNEPGLIAAIPADDL